MARKSKYSLELANDICEQIAKGKSLVSICSQEDMPCYATVMNFLRNNSEFLDKYTRAREEQADYLADELISIADSADESDYNAKKLRIETRKWIASKLKPKKYGERQQLDVDMKISVADKLAAARKRASENSDN